MRPYEVIVIFDSAADEASIDGTITRIKEFVVTKDGKTGQVEKWGRRRFAYELKHRWEGYYTLLEVTMDATVVADVDRMMTLSDDIIRHKIVRIPESVAGRARPAMNAAPAEEAEPEAVGATA